MAEKLKPALRFSGFTDDWEQRKLGDVVKLNGRIGFRGYTEKDIITKEEGGVLTFSPTNIVDNKLTTNCKNTYITRFKYDESPEIKVHNGDILFVKTGSTLGKSALITGLSEDATLNPQVVVMRVPNGEEEFIASTLVTEVVLEQVAASKIGGAVPTLTETKIKEFDISIPKMNSERYYIGNFFQNFDRLITLHQRKCDKLLSVKRSMLEKMFPKNGSDVPEIRFAGFTAPWEQRKLGEIGDLLTGFPFESKQFTESGIPLVRGMNVKRGYLDMTDDICEYWASDRGLEAYLLKENDIVIQMDGALIGRSYAMIKPENTPSLLVQRVTRVRCEVKSSDYVYQCLQRGFLDYIKGIKTETAVPHLSLNDIREYVIPFPKSNEEQAQIGVFFQTLDHLITLHQRELEKLQNIKQSCLEKMFV